jgi:hypothetical protein
VTIAQLDAGKKLQQLHRRQLQLQHSVVVVQVRAAHAIGLSCNSIGSVALFCCDQITPNWLTMEIFSYRLPWPLLKPAQMQPNKLF